MHGQTRLDFLKSEVKRLQTVIFDCRYQCRIMQRDQYDVATLQSRGIPVSGIDWVDQFADEGPVHRLLTINDMTDLAVNRINFWLDDPKTYSVVIYKAITDYVTLYTELADAYPNLPIPDQEDFEALDELACSIFKLYRCYDKEIELKGLIGRLRNRRRFSVDLHAMGMAQPMIRQLDNEPPPQREHSTLLPLLGHRYNPRKEPEGGN